MMGIINCHVTQFPSGRWGFVGRVPMCLMRITDANKADVQGGRAWFGPNRELLTAKDITFDTEQAAREFATNHSAEIAN